LGATVQELVTTAILRLGLMQFCTTECRFSFTSRFTLYTITLTLNYLSTDQIFNIHLILCVHECTYYFCHVPVSYSVINKEHIQMRGVRLSQRCCWWLTSSGILSRLGRLDSKDEGILILPNVSSYLPVGMT
jgi:hypothetical protein